MTVYQLTGISHTSNMHDDYGLYGSAELAQCELLRFVRLSVMMGDLDIPFPRSIDDLKKIPVGATCEQYDANGYVYSIWKRAVTTA